MAMILSLAATHMKMTPAEAITAVTINAAYSLNRGDQLGSLEPGKDADFVIWNGNPLSQFTKAEQTWVDGKLVIDLVVPLAPPQVTKVWVPPGGAAALEATTGWRFMVEELLVSPSRIAILIQ